MPRQACVAPGGLAYHVLNRAVGRLPLLQKPEDYDAFERVPVEAHLRHPMRIPAYCLMPNHWHLVLYPRADGQLTAFVRWLTHTHTVRRHAHYHTTGTGHLYQGRFKSFPVQTDEHFLMSVLLCRAKRAAGEPRRAGRGLALVQPVAATVPRFRRPQGPVRLAGRSAAELAADRQPAAK